MVGGNGGGCALMAIEHVCHPFLDGLDARGEWSVTCKQINLQQPRMVIISCKCVIW